MGVPAPRLTDGAIAVAVKIVVQPAAGRHVAHRLGAEASQGQEEFPPARHHILFGAFASVRLRGCSVLTYHKRRV